MSPTVHTNINDTHSTQYDWDGTTEDLKEIFNDLANDIEKLTNKALPSLVVIDIQPE